MDSSYASLLPYVLPPQALDEALGLPPAPQAEAPLAHAQPGGVDQVLESLAGLANEPLPNVPGFGGHFAHGLARGIGRSGLQIAQRRREYNQTVDRMRAARDSEHIQATRDFQRSRATALADKAKQNATESRDTEKYNRDNPVPTEDQIAEQPWLGKFRGQHVPMDWLKGGKTAAAEPLEIIDTPQGPRYVPRSEAAGKPPGRAETAADKSETIASPGVLKMYAERTLAGGPEPNFGMGQIGALNRVAYGEMLKKVLDERHMNGGDLTTPPADLAAKRQALSTVQKLHSQAKAFENNVESNLKILEESIPDLPDMGVTTLNKPLRQLALTMGSTNMQKYVTARRVVVPELTALLANPSMRGVVSDTARHEVDEILKEDATIPQLRKAIQVLRRDMANRINSYQGEIDSINSEIGQIGRPTTGAGMSDDEAFRQYQQVVGAGGGGASGVGP